jgi:predicted dehydrogenase
MSEVKVGIIGLGGMGGYHFTSFREGKVKGATVVAVCDLNPARLEWARTQGIEAGKCFADQQAFFDQGGMDAVLNVTPHYFHPPNAIEALRRHLHVLIEKPAGAYTKQVREMNAVAAQSDRVFAIMFNCRTMPLYQKMRDLVQGGELGTVRRVNWIVTDWFRTQAYYDSGGWRATWAGEGGGVLLNQCPHQLDLMQWICGMPKRVHAFVSFGKYHRIEVEDDVAAYLEYPNGATGVFITTTGEAPGTNRFELAGDRGRLVAEDGQLTFFRNRAPADVFIKESKEGFAKPECWKIDVTPPSGTDGGHVQILQNWIDVITKGGTLLAPGQEGLNSLEVSNAMLLSSWTGQAIDLPVDAEVFYQHLQERIRTSAVKKPAAQEKAANFAGTFTR